MLTMAAAVLPHEFIGSGFSSVDDDDLVGEGVRGGSDGARYGNVGVVLYGEVRRKRCARA